MLRRGQRALAADEGLREARFLTRTGIYNLEGIVKDESESEAERAAAR